MTKSKYNTNEAKNMTGPGPPIICNMAIDFYTIKISNQTQNKRTFCVSTVEDMSGFIFCNRFRELYVPESINRNLRSVIENYNAMEEVRAAKEKREAVILSQFSCHHLRHTFCAKWI